MAQPLPLLNNKTLFQASEEFHALLCSEEGLRAKKYLASRGIHEGEIKRFKIGYCNNGYFSDRVIFPVFDINGKVKNLTSRLVLKDKTAKSHLHLTGVKQDWFFNEPILKDNIKKLTLVESPIDCITLTRHGFNALACMGANNVNKGKIAKLDKVETIYICFDNDLNESGIKAANRIGQLIYNVLDKSAKLVSIPFLIGPDVNSMCMKNELAFCAEFNNLMRVAITVTPAQAKKKLHRLKNNVKKFDILKLAEQYVDLQPAGVGKYKAICPIHEEEVPSFYIDVETNRWICFGHGEQGDAIDLLRSIEKRRGNNLTFGQAIKILGKI